MSTSLKAGVDVRGIQPEILLAIQIAESIYRHHGVDCVITSCRDGRHGAGSYHYTGLAADIRTKNVPRTRVLRIVGEVKLALGSQFDVVFEDMGKPNEHLHIEFDPPQGVIDA